MTIDHGRSASPSGHSRAEPEEVSALRASVPNADCVWPPIEEFGSFAFVRREIVDHFANPQGTRTSTAYVVRRTAGSGA